MVIILGVSEQETDMKNRKPWTAILVLFLAGNMARLFAMDEAPPARPLPDVKVEDRTLRVNGEPFVMRGVCYSPTPVGKDYRYNWSQDKENYLSDFKMLNEMGCNTIRVFGAQPYSEALLDAAYEHGLHVIIGYWVSHEVDLADPSVQSNLLDEFTRIVKRHRHHPAVLIWQFGTEVSEHNETGYSKDWYQLVERAAKAAHALDNRPVSTAEVNGDKIGDPGLCSTDAEMPHLDLWAVNTFGDIRLRAVWEHVSLLTDKPIWFEQIGIDAYNAQTASEDEEMQAEVVRTLWESIEPQLSATQPTGICVGCTMFEWSDEWWKANLEGGNDFHDTAQSWECPPYPDPSIQEEWFGIVAVEPGTSTRRPRKAYYALKDLWSKDDIE
ncbi:MAG: hypothetical protein EOM20_06700 [Spartobacteria bacterium]|nr:hypothetical protein [Spartobacteria bacterium]